MEELIITSNDGRMSSLEIAQITEREHKDVMRSIRNMEESWLKIAGRNFALGTYKDANKQDRPCYYLTKTECLYVATKFNDEARAKLVLRWEQLEIEKRTEQSNLSPAVIITSLLGDYSGIAEEVEKQLQNQDKNQESDEVVSIHQFNMLSQAYDAKFNECEKLKAQNQELEKSNIKLMEEVNKYRYFIECQKNEIEKL